MIKTGAKISRREQILSALAQTLKDNPGERITTSSLSKLVGVSEAALYRHFPSKTKMFEGLIEFIEDTVFSQMTIVLAEEKFPLKRCELIIGVLLKFAEDHPGMSRLLIGDALTGETARLRQRIMQFFERIETQLKQLLREAELRQDFKFGLPADTLAHFLMAYADGVMVKFVRSEFQMSPSIHWQEQWHALVHLLVNIDLIEA